MVNAEGQEVPLRGMAWHGWIDAEWEAHEGRAPVSDGVAEGRGWAPDRAGPGGHGSMLGHAAGGIVPVDDSCATQVPGLYAAGDVAARASWAPRTQASGSPPCTRR